jgi:hypothetical protein
VTPECSDVFSYDVDAGYFAVFDLGDASLADSQGVGEFSLGDTGGLMDLGELESADVRFAAFTRGGLSSSAFRLVSRVELLSEARQN